MFETPGLPALRSFNEGWGTGQEALTFAWRTNVASGNGGQGAALAAVAQDGWLGLF